MWTFFDVLPFCYAGFFLFMIVNRFEMNRLLANLLMLLLLGVTAALSLVPANAGTQQVVGYHKLKHPQFLRTFLSKMARTNEQNAIWAAD